MYLGFHELQSAFTKSGSDRDDHVGLAAPVSFATDVPQMPV